MMCSCNRSRCNKRVRGLKVRCATQVSAYSPTVIALAIPVAPCGKRAVSTRRDRSGGARRRATPLRCVGGRGAVPHEVRADVGGLVTPRRQSVYPTQPRWLRPPAIATPRNVSVHSGCGSPLPFISGLAVSAAQAAVRGGRAPSSGAERPQVPFLPGAPPQIGCYQRLLGDPLPRQDSNSDYSTMKSGICRVVLVWYSAYGG
jgi:hypothetical protein